MEDRIREILDANCFLEKIEFIKNVLKGWIKHGRLGGRPACNPLASAEDSVPQEMFWQGTQERSQNGTQGTKFVWVTVGAPDGDGEYRSIMLKEGEKTRVDKRTKVDYDNEMEVIKDRLRVLGRE